MTDRRRALSEPYPSGRKRWQHSGHAWKNAPIPPVRHMRDSFSSPLQANLGFATMFTNLKMEPLRM